MNAALIMIRSAGEHRLFPVTKDVTIIGRREDCDLRIPLGEISRKHCRLVRNGVGFSVEDMGSSNGTYVNGARVQSLELEPGDTVQMGPVAFVLQVEGEPAVDEIRPMLLTPKSGEEANQKSGSGDGELATSSSGGAGSDDDDALDILNSADSLAPLDLSSESASPIQDIPTQIDKKR